MKINILSVSDIVIPTVYQPDFRKRFFGKDIIISCGDLPYDYLDYLVSTLDIPLFFVRGNHDIGTRNSGFLEIPKPGGGEELHNRIVEYRGIILGGIEGSIKYKPGPYMYSQSEMWWFVFNLIPQMALNKLKKGRYIDIFVSHAPPWGIHDQTDFAHQGIKAFNWFIQVFQPVIHLYGHIHVYKKGTYLDAQIGKTKIINSYGLREIGIECP